MIYVTDTSVPQDHALHIPPHISDGILPSSYWTRRVKYERGHHYSDAVNNLIHRVQLIEASLARIKEKTAELLMLISPVECLPAEILVMVFQAGSKMETNVGLPFAMLVASVSRRWRDVALNTPTIWTNLQISLGKPRRWVTLALDRSQNRLLDITIDGRASCTPSTIAVVSYMSLVCLHMHRWRRFNLIAHHRDVVLAVSEVLADAQSPSLQDLRLSLTGSGPAGNQEVAVPRILEGGVPSLVSVRFDSVALPWRNPPLTGLSTLDIRWLWNRTRLAYSQFRDLLAASPALTKLILRGKHVELRPGSEYEPICLPALRYLELSGDNVCRMCSLLITPALETLTLVNVDESEFREFVGWLPFAGPRYGALQSLSFVNVATCTLTGEFTSAFSTITQLSIVNSNADQFLELLRTKQSDRDACITPGMLIWPRLKHITLLDDANYDKLYGMVAERAAMSTPLQRLILHAPYTHNTPLMAPLMQYVKIDGVTYLDRDP